KALGITEYDCYEGRKKAGASTATCPQVPGKKIPDVLANAADLNAYHMLFLSCAYQAFDSFYSPPSPGTTAAYDVKTASANLAASVAGGGRMIGTDPAYDYIEQAFPDAITFAGPTAASGVAQSIDGANRGCSASATTSFPATVDDDQLTKWLKVVGITT